MKYPTYDDRLYRCTVRRSVRLALDDGIIKKQPCEVCGLLDVEAHHDDYSKPLEVRWLCRKHHLDLHKALRKARLWPAYNDKRVFIGVNSPIEEN